MTDFKTKWQGKTRGGFPAKLNEEYGGKLFGRYADREGNWHGMGWHADGQYLPGEACALDLIPYKPSVFDEPQEGDA